MEYKFFHTDTIVKPCEATILNIIIESRQDLDSSLCRLKSGIIFYTFASGSRDGYGGLSMVNWEVLNPY